MGLKRARYIGAPRRQSDGFSLDGFSLVPGEHGWVETTRDRGTEFVLGNGDRFTVYADEVEIVTDPLPMLDLPHLVRVTIAVFIAGVAGFLWGKFVR